MTRMHAVHIACSARRLPQHGHIWNCTAGPGEPCINRGTQGKEALLGIHTERVMAWAALPIEERHAILVAAKLRGATRNDDG